MSRAERLLLISGPVGVGKTTVAHELSGLLEAEGVPHCFVDLDSLAQTYPRDPSDPYGTALALENLAAVWANGRKRGARNLVVSRVIEARAEALDIARVVGLAEPVVCRLTASDETLLTRVRQREVGAGLDWHEKRALELASQMKALRFEDFLVKTDDRSVPDIAAEIHRQVRWLR